MIAFRIILVTTFILFYVIMMGVMIIFERDKPRNIISWSLVFLFTQLIGYCIYATIRLIFCKKRHDLLRKQEEDIIYSNLISNKLKNRHQSSSDEIFNFNELAYNSKLTTRNNCTIFNNYEEFKNDLLTNIKNAKSYIILEVRKINILDFQIIIDNLIEKAENGITVKLVHDKRINNKIKKQLKMAGVKVYRFSKHNTLGGVYSNLRNHIIIDGQVAYLANTYIKNKNISNKFDISEVILKLKGEIVEEIDITTHQDYVFASGKYMDFAPVEKQTDANLSTMQFVSNEFTTDIELLIIKAICSAKKSIQLQLEQFIPTESILSLLQFAINSNIDVRLMVPLKTNMHSKYFASRAYAKELALMGANVYLYDGYIRFNGIVIDSEYVLYGSFSMDREHISMGIQSVMIMKDEKIVKHFNKIFDRDINNSYRINNAKYMLLREKFFKNFV